jgi:hypothetical protein
LEVTPGPNPHGEVGFPVLRYCDTDTVTVGRHRHNHAGFMNNHLSNLQLATCKLKLEPTFSSAASSSHRSSTSNDHLILSRKPGWVGSGIWNPRPMIGPISGRGGAGWASGEGETCAWAPCRHPKTRHACIAQTCYAQPTPMLVALPYCHAPPTQRPTSHDRHVVRVGPPSIMRRTHAQNEELHALQDLVRPLPRHEAWRALLSTDSPRRPDSVALVHDLTT